MSGNHIRKLGISATLTLVLGACSGGIGTTYGTGDTQEAALAKGLMGAIGSSTADSEPIAYKNRAPIVLPPDGIALPSPQAYASASNQDWPTDPDELRKLRAKLKKANSHEALLRDLEPGKVFTPQELAYIRDNNDFGGSRVASSNAGANDIHGAPLSPDVLRKIKRVKDDNSKTAGLDANGIPTRRYLTDPPTAYRIPAKTAAYGVIKDEEEPKKKSGSIFSRLWPF